MTHRAIISTKISIHRVDDKNECRECTTQEKMKEYEIPLATILTIDGFDEFECAKKVKQWMNQTKSI